MLGCCSADTIANCTCWQTNVVDVIAKWPLVTGYRPAPVSLSKLGIDMNNAQEVAAKNPEWYPYYVDLFKQYKLASDETMRILYARDAAKNNTY